MMRHEDLASPFKLARILPSPTSEVGNFLGDAIAVDGNLALINSSNGQSGVDGGSGVYLVEIDTGALVRSFFQPTPTQFGDQFGASVALSKDRVLIGEFGGGLRNGAAYLFDAKTGNLLQTFRSPIPATINDFGEAVAIQGNTFLVGDGSVDNFAGAVDQFNQQGQLLRTFRNPTADPEDYFGRAISVSGNRIVIGAYGDNTGGIDAGAAYLFDRKGNLLQTFLNPTPDSGDYFGISVAINGNRVLIGSQLDDTAARNGGAAYLFDATTGNLLQTFLEPAAAPDNQFGDSVAIQGNTVLIGSRFNDTGAIDSGAAYVFDAGSGTLVQSLFNPTPQVGEEFGNHVAISENYLLVNAPFGEVNGVSSGAVYVFQPSIQKDHHSPNCNDILNGRDDHTRWDRNPFPERSYARGNTRCLGTPSNDSFNESFEGVQGRSPLDFTSRDLTPKAGNSILY
ncbi:MAG: FG-GAP repeat protein [Myxacorys chilensis ATA2-1-KO14]|nr:FG-GAP repeat protein [Myxacorys chilensis ATA2-1-KO14]